MNDAKYIGLDVHQLTISAVVRVYRLTSPSVDASTPTESDTRRPRVIMTPSSRTRAQAGTRYGTRIARGSARRSPNVWP
jgi:hypothetical protein